MREALRCSGHTMKRNSSGGRLPAICFVLTAKDLGLYPDMTAVAALSVRRLHPQAQIILVTDEPTARAIDRASHALGKIATGIVVRPTGTEDPCVGARYLRTILRQLIKGDYLYLDSDTVAVRPLDRGWPEGADLAVARDRNQWGITPLALPGVEKLRAKLGWKFRIDRYLNAGVMFVRDTPAAHAFYAEWHRRWKQALSLGMWQDQFSFNSVIATGTATIAILPDRDNWVTHSTVMLRGRARIFHFFASLYGDEIPASTLLGHLTKRFQRDGTLDEVTIASATKDNFPWMDDVRLKHLLASGLYLRAAGLVASSIIRRIRRKFSLWAHARLLTRD
jgi:Nucleotide-diphospho-sugar transferase